MQGTTNKYKIYENSKCLKSALDKTLSSINQTTDNIILINISYSDDKSNNSPYSGMKYIINLRAEQKDITPVLFYGFESLENLKKKIDASILNSPAIEYIEIPFKISKLVKLIDKLHNTQEIEEALDEKTQKNLAVKKVRSFKHIGKNIHTTMLINAENARESIQTQPEKYPKPLNRFKKETIKTWLKDYEELLPVVKALKIRENGDIIKILKDAIGCVEIINSKCLPPAHSVKKAFDVTDKIKEVCDLLSKLEGVTK